MKALLFHSYVSKINGREQQIFSIFINSPRLNLAEFEAEIVEATKTVSTLDAIHIVGYDIDIKKVRDALKQADETLLPRLLSLIGDHREALRLIQFDTTRGEYIATFVSGDEVLDPLLIAAEREKTLLAVFQNGGGEQRAPIGTHFAKGSTSHADRFLRVSNVLEDAGKVHLIAFWVIKHIWKSHFEHLVVDTSGLYSVALAALHEASVRGGLEGRPSVWSHRSHDGVRDITPDQAKTALFLVSASTSGGLVGRLIAQGANPEKIVTLFLLSAKPAAAGYVLCNLHTLDGDGLEEISNYPEHDCPMCREFFHLINIQGDQFAITPPNIRLIDIKATDIPKEIKPVLSALLGLHCFIAYRRNKSGRICTLALDVMPILLNDLSEKNRIVLSQKREEWQVAIRRASTISLKHVVASTYRGSSEIASSIVNAVRGITASVDRPAVISAVELRRAEPESHTSTIVLSACIDDGKELLSVSRTLRDVQENGLITYLSVATLMASKSDASRLRSNLTVGQYGIGTHSMHTLINLPIDCYEEESSWTSELEHLKRLISWADNSERDLPHDLENRVVRLQKAPADGLVDDLFWPADDSTVLALRSDFSLIPDARRVPEATQADLFAVISTALYKLRQNTDSRKLAHNAYERAVLSPLNFDRFSDGVLQACLLRAAHPKELAYGSCDLTVSEQMLGVLQHMLSGDSPSDSAEAIMEFMIALLIKRLTLHRIHLKEVCNLVINADGIKSKTAKLIAIYLIEQERQQDYLPHGDDTLLSS